MRGWIGSMRIWSKSRKDWRKDWRWSSRKVMIWRSRYRGWNRKTRPFSTRWSSRWAEWENSWQRPRVSCRQKYRRMNSWCKAMLRLGCSLPVSKWRTSWASRNTKNWCVQLRKSMSSSRGLSKSMREWLSCCRKRSSLKKETRRNTSANCRNVTIRSTWWQIGTTKSAKKCEPSSKETDSSRLLSNQNRQNWQKF